MTLDEGLSGGLDPAALTTTRFGPRRLHRVHHQRFGALEFNATGRGHARFSPLRVSDGASAQLIPTLYAATTIEVALMETALRDAPIPSRGYILRERDVAPLRATGVELESRLLVIDFRAVALRKLGLTRAEVIDSGPDAYPQTRALAAWAHRCAPAAQGILWMSRQDDRDEALILFGDRIAEGALRAIDPDQVLTRGRIHAALLGLLDLLGGSFQAD